MLRLAVGVLTGVVTLASSSVLATPGALDPTFGAGGTVTTNLRLDLPSSGSAAMVVQAGKIVAVGGDFALVRYNTDGSLDTSFGSGGRVITPLGYEARALAVQADGKLIAAGAGLNDTLTGYGLAVVRYNVDGSLDTSFGGDGKVVTELDPSTSKALAVAVQADGKIVAAGERYNGGSYGFVLARYNNDGSLDTSFDADGSVTTIMGSNSSGVRALAIQTNGKIVAAGYAVNGGYTDFALARYNTDGSLDSSFDGDGKIITSVGTHDSAYGVVLQADGKLVAAGWAFDGSISRLALFRYNTDGSLDSSFDGDGTVTALFGGTDAYAYALAVQPDGKLVVAGNSLSGFIDSFGLARFNTDGSLDSSFDGDGRVITAIDSESTAYALAIQTDGRLVAAGGSSSGSNNYFALARYDTSGGLDSSFDADGKVTSAAGSGGDVAEALVVQADGKLVVAGYSTNGSNLDFALARYNTDGSLDTSLDGDGKVTTPLGGTDDVALAAVVQADGKLVIAGYSNNGSNTDFALARYNSDGSLDTSFDGDGKVTTPVGAGYDYAYSVALQADGKLVAAGASYNGSNYDFALVRYNTDGSLDTSFDGDGKATTPLSQDDFAYALVVQPDGKLVAAGYSYNGSSSDFGLVRYNPDGSLDTSFDGDGKVIVGAGSSHDSAEALLLQPDGKLVAAGSAYNGSNYDFALVRLNPDGSLDTSFDGDGRVTTAVGSGQDYAYTLVAQANGKLVLAGSSENGGHPEFALVRYNSDGSLDLSFDGDAKVTTAIAGQAYVRALALQADGKLVAAGYSYNGSNNDFALARYQGDTVCGNSITEAGEQCDDGNAASGDCCSSTCQYESSGSACPGDGNVCTDDVCDGAGTCGVNNTAPCSSDGVGCTVDACDGAGACTHTPSNALCDDSLYCNGAESCGLVDGLTAVVPSALAATEGNSNNGFPFSCTPHSSVRYQQVYTGTAVGSGTITAVRFRVDVFGGFLPGVSPGVTVKLSTTMAAPDSLSATFADNVGADETTVFSGNLSLSSACSTTPCPFEVVLPFSTPFVFHSTSGNLLLEVTASGCIAGGPLDAQQSSGDEISVAVGFTAASTVADFMNTLGLVTQFQFSGGYGCNSGTPPSVDDGIACTVDSCDEPTDTMLHVPNHPACNDGNVCTDDTCSPATGCGYAPNTLSCDDGLYCNGTDTCSGSNCSVHAGDPCPAPDGDGNCAEACDEDSETCSAPDVDGSSCTDGNVCTLNDACISGLCYGNPNHCGDGTVQFTCGEQCDDGGISNDGGCSLSCLLLEPGRACLRAIGLQGRRIAGKDLTLVQKCLDRVASGKLACQATQCVLNPTATTPTIVAGSTCSVAADCCPIFDSAAPTSTTQAKVGQFEASAAKAVRKACSLDKGPDHLKGTGDDTYVDPQTLGFGPNCLDVFGACASVPTAVLTSNGSDDDLLDCMQCAGETVASEVLGFHFPLAASTAAQTACQRAVGLQTRTLAVKELTLRQRCLDRVANASLACVSGECVVNPLKPTQTTVVGSTCSTSADCCPLYDHAVPTKTTQAKLTTAATKALTAMRKSCSVDEGTDGLKGSDDDTYVDPQDLGYGGLCLGTFGQCSAIGITDTVQSGAGNDLMECAACTTDSAARSTSAFHLPPAQ